MVLRHTEFIGIFRRAKRAAKRLKGCALVVLRHIELIRIFLGERSEQAAAKGLRLSGAAPH